MASVFHYNVLSRIMAAIINRLFGIPPIAFYDDLGAPTPFELGEEALDTVSEARRLLETILNPRKCDCGNPLSFLGLLGAYPNRGNSWRLAISLTSEKVCKWSTQIQTFLHDGQISHTELQKLIGKLPVAQSMVFGKCARAPIRPLYVWRYSAYFSTHISIEIAEVLRWWIRLLRSLKPTIVTFLPRFPEFIIFYGFAI